MTMTNAHAAIAEKIERLRLTTVDRRLMVARIRAGAARLSRRAPTPRRFRHLSTLCAILAKLAVAALEGEGGMLDEFSLLAEDLRRLRADLQSKDEQLAEARLETCDCLAWISSMSAQAKDFVKGDTK
jgi:hypothetical protein